MNHHFEAKLTDLGTSSAEVDERFVRGSGPGGQKINKTSSCVTLRHRPTGIEVRCQKERSQSANRAHAWEQLCAKLADHGRSAAAERRKELEDERRRTRQKSRKQKTRMIDTKRHRAGIKTGRRKATRED